MQKKKKVYETYLIFMQNLVCEAIPEKRKGFKPFNYMLTPTYMSHAKRGALDISLLQVSRTQETRLWRNSYLPKSLLGVTGKDKKQPMTSSLPSRNL